MFINALYTAAKNSSFFAVVILAYVSITPHEALQYADSPDHFFLDVRESYEYEAGHVPGAMLMPWSSGVLNERWNELPGDKTIIVYCKSGGRSAAASQFLSDRGVTNIVNMTGGFSSYSSLAGAKIETGPYQEPITPVSLWTLY